MRGLLDQLPRKQYDAVLAGLRLLQKALDNGTVEPNDGDIGTILTCDGEHEGMGPDDIDAFCTELQGG